VMDINPDDKYKEIFIHTPGPSSDDNYLVLYFDGRNIKKSGEIERWIRYVGKGTVIIDNWAGFWVSTEKYILDKNHLLKPVPQKIYYVDVKVTPVRDFIIYNDPFSQKEIGKINAGENITVLSYESRKRREKPYDPNAWYLILSEKRILGWA